MYTGVIDLLDYLNYLMFQEISSLILVFETGDACYKEESAVGKSSNNWSLQEIKNFSASNPSAPNA